jgi:hypothetical protein
MDKRLPEGEPIIEGKSICEEWAPEGKSVREERMPKGKSICEERMPEGKSVPEEWAPEGKSVANESIAVERESGSHEAACKGRPTKAATTKVPPTKATSAVKGGRTQCRAGRDNRRSGQCNHYLVNHDAPPSVRRCTPAFRIRTQQFPLSCSPATVSLGVPESQRFLAFS